MDDRRSCPAETSDAHVATIDNRGVAYGALPEDAIAAVVTKALLDPQDKSTRRDWQAQLQAAGLELSEAQQAAQYLEEVVFATRFHAEPQTKEAAKRVSAAAEAAYDASLRGAAGLLGESFEYAAVHRELNDMQAALGQGSEASNLTGLAQHMADTRDSAASMPLSPARALPQQSQPEAQVTGQEGPASSSDTWGADKSAAATSSCEPQAKRAKKEPAEHSQKVAAAKQERVHIAFGRRSQPLSGTSRQKPAKAPDGNVLNSIEQKTGNQAPSALQPETAQGDASLTMHDISMSSMPSLRLPEATASSISVSTLVVDQALEELPAAAGTTLQELLDRQGKPSEHDGFSSTGHTQTLADTAIQELVSPMVPAWGINAFPLRRDTSPGRLLGGSDSPSTSPPGRTGSRLTWALNNNQEQRFPSGRELGGRPSSPGYRRSTSASVRRTASVGPGAARRSASVVPWQLQRVLEEDVAQLEVTLLRATRSLNAAAEQAVSEPSSISLDSHTMDGTITELLTQAQGYDAQTSSASQDAGVQVTRPSSAAASLKRPAPTQRTVSTGRAPASLADTERRSIPWNATSLDLTEQLTEHASRLLLHVDSSSEDSFSSWVSDTLAVAGAGGHAAQPQPFGAGVCGAAAAASGH
ncbi:hypothetical protein WJX73_006117 [Symbiochloris irregularis]|uniref:Uncharacterized protein n=1 Tax=Symbiochloris irregularis TaxID=706552 RepID=A0AAW1NJG3_9CHLO